MEDDYGKKLGRMLTEATLTRDFLKCAKEHLRNVVAIKHSDGLTSGIPDVSLTWKGFTSWIEVKFADPEFQSNGLQELTCCRLAIQGKCFYLIYHESPKMVSIVEPKALGDWRKSVLYSAGFDHRWVVEHVRRSHMAGFDKRLVDRPTQ